MRKKLLSMLALLLTAVTGAWADEWDVVYMQTQTTAANWTALDAGSTTGKTLGKAEAVTYYYVTSNLSFTNATAGGSGLTIRGTVYLYVPEGKTLTCTGANASGLTGGGAGIELTEGNTLYLIGGGTVNATGGKAANGGNGGKGDDAYLISGNTILGGSGGAGGYGGGGAGAGIGTRGANGGNGGAGGQRTGQGGQETTQYGVDGNAGSAGGTAGRMGIVNKMSNTTLNAQGGAAGSNGTGGNRGLTASQHPGSNVYMASGGGGGGAGAGIGTRGGDGGKNNARPSQDKCTEFRNYSGFNGFNGQNGATAGAMGSIYLYQGSSITVNATGGTAGTAAGSSGGKGLNALDDEGTAQDVYSIAGGAGGGGGGFGGAASDIGTGGPGGGAGGFGGYAGIGDCSSHGFYQAGAYGGKGGQNADGSYAPDGEDNIMNSLLSNLGQTNVKSEDLSGYENKGWYTSDATTWCGRGGKPGTYGDAATSGSIGTVTVDWTTQEDDWGLICLQTGSTRADWVPLADNASTGKTLGAVGTTTYYYTLFDRTFTNSNAGGSGLTILGTVYLYIPSGKTITCTGINASGAIGGGAGIELTAGNTLYLIGGGKIVATGGQAANGCNGGAGGDANFSVDGWVLSGAGGKGGDGGGGAGAGIGTCGGAGGAGGTGGASNKVNLHGEPTGNVGGNGASGSTAAEMGTLYIYQLPAPTTEFHGGSGGTASDNGGKGGRHALYLETVFLSTYTWSIGGGGGGGGGGFGGAASDIGTGGPGGGGGGGGASGSIQWRNAANKFYQVGALGGSPGTNVDGTLAGAGESTLMVSDDKNLLARKYPENEAFGNAGWQEDDNRVAGGNGNGGGSASTSGTANTVTAGWPTQGLGTEGAPFIISNTTDWNDFVNCVNGKYTFSGQFVKLSSNISVSNMAGSNDAKSFQGTFDGDGHTLTFTKGTDAEPFAEEYCAPFRHVKNAVIGNLHVDGTIYTSRKKAAGIVGESLSALELYNCRSSISIHSSVSGDGTHGGLVSTLSGSEKDIYIDGCVFDGSFATTATTNNCGGFVGWPVYNRPVIENSLMIPASVGAGMLANTFTRVYSTNEPTITNCYYVAVDNLPANQGTAATVLNITPANPDYDYGMVKAYKNGIWFDGNFYGIPATVTLADNADNSTAISGADGCVADVTLSGRTLYKDGAWNTICLPFDVTLSGSPLEDAVARPLESASISGTTLTLTFGDAVTTLEAGTPYIIKWIADANYVDDDEHNIVSPVFSGVTIDKTERNYDNGEANGDKRVRFMGTYKSTTFGSEDKSILLMGGSNTLYWPQLGASIGAQRAYFKLGDGAQLARITSFSIDFGDDETTGIISIENGKLKIENDADAWFTLDGRKLDAKPSRAGVYINNGKKVVIK